MKKHIAIAASAVLASVPLSSGVSASEYSTGDMLITYTAGSESVTVTGCETEGTRLEIPDTIDGLPVTEIAANAFSDCSSLLSVTLPDSVEEIGKYAFYNCKSLVNVSIGDGTDIIGDYAFSACPSLTEFTVGSANESFCAREGILFDKNGTTLVSYAGYPDAVIPEGTQAIGKAAFFGNTTLESADLGDVSAIGDYAFSGCTSLKEIALPDSVTKLGKGSFMSCSSLKTVSVGENIKSVPGYCFGMCPRLMPFDMNNITTLGAYSLYGSINLSGIAVPDTVTYLGKSSLGMHYSVSEGCDAAVHGFYISGKTGSAAEEYADNNSVDFLDYDNILYGDVDGDNAVNSSDASSVLTEYALTSTGRNPSFTYYQTVTGDYDCDGAINSIDASRILSAYAESATKR